MSEDDLFNVRLSLIADPVNRRILEHIFGGSQYPEDLARKMGFSRSALEQRVARLVEAGFVRKLAERDSQRVVLIITPEAERVREWLQQLRGLGPREEARQEPQPPSAITIAAEEMAKPEPPKTRGFLERVPLPLIAFMIFETVALVSFCDNYSQSKGIMGIVSWVVYTALGIVAAKFVAWLNRLARKRVEA